MRRAAKAYRSVPDQICGSLSSATTLRGAEIPLAGPLSDVFIHMSSMPQPVTYPYASIFRLFRVLIIFLPVPLI